MIWRGNGRRGLYPADLHTQSSLFHDLRHTSDHLAAASGASTGS